MVYIYAVQTISVKLLLAQKRANNLYMFSDNYIPHRVVGQVLTGGRIVKCLEVL